MATRHTRSKEADIDRLSKSVFGNGKDGLIQNVATILEKTKGIEATLGDLQTDVSGLVKFQTEVMTEKDLNDKRKLNGWQVTSILGTLILGVCAIVATIIFKA